VPNNADQGHHFGVGQSSVDQALKHFWGLAEQVRGHCHDHVAAGENLAPGQVAVISEHIVQQGAGVPDAKGFLAFPAAVGSVERGSQALSGPPRGGQFCPPAAH
jgi:hypothetical protein